MKDEVRSLPEPDGTSDDLDQFEQGTEEEAPFEAEELEGQEPETRGPIPADPGTDPKQFVRQRT